MKRFLILALSLLPFVGATNASAQSWRYQDGSDQFGSGTSVQTAPISLFARYSFQTRTSRTQQPWQVGLAISQPRYEQSQNAILPTFRSSRSGIELRFDGRNFGVWSPGSEGLLLAGTSRGLGKLSATEEADKRPSGIAKGLIIGGAIVGGIVLIAALSADKEPLLCSGNTVPNPIAGTCVPVG